MWSNVSPRRCRARRRAAAFPLPAPSLAHCSQLPPSAPSTIAAALECDIIVLSLTTALVEAQAIVEALRSQVASAPAPASGGAAGGDDGGGGEGDDAAAPPSKTVIALSTTLSLIHI